MSVLLDASIIDLEQDSLLEDFVLRLRKNPGVIGAKMIYCEIVIQSFRLKRMLETRHFFVESTGLVR